nr:PHP domain-containing protein [Candidatus Sigynarchaeota archaeon]
MTRSRRIPGKNAVLIIGGSLVAAWVLFLVIMHEMSSRSPVFYDYLGQTDVSDQYTSELPIGRYILEPIFALINIIAIDPIKAIYLFIPLLVIGRISFAIVDKLVLKGNKKKEIIMDHVRNVVNFFWKYVFLSVGIGLVVAGTGLGLRGFQFLNNYFNGILEVLVWSLTFFLAVKIVYNVATLLHPKLKFRVGVRKTWKNFPHSSLKYWAHKVPDVMAREPRYLVSVFVMFVVLVYFIEAMPLPTHRIVAQSLGPNEYLFDFHMHTWYSDGSLSPEGRVDWCIRNGIRGAAITDHDNNRGVQIAIDYVQRNHLNFTVIPGEEFTVASGIHLNIFGLSQQYAPESNYSPGWPEILYLNVSDMIHDVHNKGGFVITNHDGGWEYPLETLFDWGVDGFELVSNVHFFPIRQFCIDHHIACIAGSDEHENGDLKSFVRINLNDPSNITELFTRLKDNTHQVVQIQLTNDIVDLPGTTWNTLEMLIDYFGSMDTGMTASWIAWSCAAYAILAMLVIRVKRTDYESMASKLVPDPRKRCWMFKIIKIHRKP